MAQDGSSSVAILVQAGLKLTVKRPWGNSGQTLGVPYGRPKSRVGFVGSSPTWGHGFYGGAGPGLYGSQSWMAKFGNPDSSSYGRALWDLGLVGPGACGGLDPDLMGRGACEVEFDDLPPSAAARQKSPRENQPG